MLMNVMGKLRLKAQLGSASRWAGKLCFKRLGMAMN